MGKQKYFKSFAIVLFLMLLPALNAQALTLNFPNFPNNPPANQTFLKVLEKMCAIRIKINQKFPGFPVPRICKTKTPKPPTLEFNVDPSSIVEGESATLSWASDNTVSCEASNGWTGEKTLSGEEEVSPIVTTTYTLTCDGVDTGIEKSVIVDVTPLPPPPPPPPTDVCPNLPGDQATIPDGYHKEGEDCIEDLPPPPPPPTLDHIIISEVYYDVDTTSRGADTMNEWVEIYNGTGSSVDLTGWRLYDSGTTFGAIATGTILADNSFLILTPSTTTDPFWSTGTFSSLGHNIGNGLANGGDAVLLKNPALVTVDAMSYGSNTSVFTLPNPSVTDGHSWIRASLTTDTDAATDWADTATPTPGL